FHGIFPDKRDPLDQTINYTTRVFCGAAAASVFSFELAITFSLIDSFSTPGNGPFPLSMPVIRAGR
ncbi:hypothetical protein QMA69_26495, partial [Burkholderia pseudomallei]|nr:hypothetical protein [Burkholderia pseudomallei]